MWRRCFEFVLREGEGKMGVGGGCLYFWLNLEFIRNIMEVRGK